MTMTVFFLILVTTGAVAAAVYEWVRAEYWRSQYKATFEPVEPVSLRDDPEFVWDYVSGTWEDGNG